MACITGSRTWRILLHAACAALAYRSPNGLAFGLLRQGELEGCHRVPLLASTHMYGANKLLPLSLFHSLCVPEGKHDIASTITDSRAVLLKLLSKCRDGILTNGMGAAAQHARRPLHKMHL